MRLEKYQQFVKVESIINERLRKISLGFIVSGMVAFVIQWEFLAYLTLYLWILSFILALCLPIYGLVFLMFFVNRAYRVRLNDRAEKEFSENQLDELKDLVSKINNGVTNRVEDESGQPTTDRAKKKSSKFTRRARARAVNLGLNPHTQRWLQQSWSEGSRICMHLSKLATIFCRISQTPANRS